MAGSRVKGSLSDALNMSLFTWYEVTEIEQGMTRLVVIRTALYRYHCVSAVRDEVRRAAHKYEFNA